MTLDKILHFLAKAAVRLHCLPKGDIRHMYVWKASAVAYARVRGEPLTIKMVDEWCFWEQRYANAGYWPFTLDRLPPQFTITTFPPFKEIFSFFP